MSIEIPKTEQLYQKLKTDISHLLTKYDPTQVHLIGIYSGGAWLAERLHHDLGLTSELGCVNTSLYRDDFQKIGLHPQTQASHIPFDVNNKHLILIDDILFTGRSVRAAINELFDYGRPRSIELAVLIDRGGRELPIQADVCAGVFALDRQTYFVLSQNQENIFDITLKKVDSSC